MTRRLLNFGVGLLLWAVCLPSRAQVAGQTWAYAAWLELRPHGLVLNSGGKTTPVPQNVVVLNGTRLNQAARTATLADGHIVPLREGDRISLNGAILSATPEPAPAAKSAPPVPTAAPVAARKAAAPAAEVPFSYLPPKPVHGQLKGVVELGASGFNSFIVRIDKQKNWQLEQKEFGNSLVLENIATPEDVRKSLKEYIGKMLDYGVPGRDIHFVVSSGAALADVTKRIVQGLKELNYVVHPVTAEQEGAYGLRAAVPAAFAGRAFMVDLGSGNTKIAWGAPGGPPRSADTYGAKYFQQGIDDATVAGGVRAAAAQVPGSQRGTCFILGGVPAELAKAARQGQERYTVLRAPAEGAAAGGGGAKLKSGLTIYQALAETTGCTRFVFDWDANFTIGYLLALPQ